MPDPGAGKSGKDASAGNGRHAEVALRRLLEVMAQLRDPDSGCPWDVEQTFRSIAAYTIEEAYEVADAIERGDMQNLRNELGDLLLQVVYHAQIAAELGLFDFAGIAETVTGKMIRRHPHVFGASNRNKSAAEQIRDWEDIKAGERQSVGERTAGTLSGIPLNLAALTRSAKLQARAARVGFDWPDATGVAEKIAEEAAELAETRKEGIPHERVEEEFGDLVFALVGLARQLDIDPEAALRSANAKFAKRFAAVEAKLAECGRSPQDASLAELDSLWDEAKAEAGEPR